MNIAEFFIRMSADNSGLKKGMTEAQTSVDRGVRAMTSALGKLGVGLSAGAFLHSIVRNSIEAQDAMAQLAARVQSTGGAAGRSVAQLDALSMALQRQTTFGDEAIKGAESLLLTFKKIRGDEFDRATKATLDLATAMGSDLNSAALQLGKALEDPVRGLTALRRSGVSFTQGQQDVIKAMVQAGNVAGAQNMILAEMETQFGGAAAAARDTLGGALKALGNAWGDALEVSRESSTGIIGAINGITDTLPTVRGWVDGLSREIQILGVKLAVLVEQLKLVKLAVDGDWIWSSKARAAFAEQQAALDRMRTAADDVNESIMLGTAEAGAGVRTLTQNFEQAADAAGALDDRVKELRSGLGDAGEIMKRAGRTDITAAQAFEDEFMKAAGARFGGAGGITAPPSAAATARSGFAGPAAPTARTEGRMDQVLGAILGPLKALFGELQSVLGPMAVAGEFLNGVFAALAPVIDALMVPIRNIGFLLGSVLAPVLELLQPILDGVAKAFSFVIQGIGEFLKGLGKAINFLLPGNPANGLVRFGENMVALAKQTRDAINAGADLTKQMDKTARSAANIPPIFDLMARRRDAGSDTTVGMRTAQFRSGTTVVINNPPAGMDPKVVARQVVSAIQMEKRRGGSTSFDLAVQGAE